VVDFSADADAGHGDVMRAPIFILGICLLATGQAVLADGGIVLFRHKTDRWLVTMFSSSTPIAGEQSDLSVLLQRNGSLEPVLDGQVSLVFTPADSGKEIAGIARRQQSQNKLFYSMPVKFDQSGAWGVRVRIKEGGTEGETDGYVNVERPLPNWQAYWPYVAMPPVLTVLFAIRETLVQRRAEKAT
jgi:hypothetical protein